MQVTPSDTNDPPDTAAPSSSLQSDHIAGDPVGTTEIEPRIETGEISIADQSDPDTGIDNSDEIPRVDTSVVNRDIEEAKSPACKETVPRTEDHEIVQVRNPVCLCSMNVFP